MNYYEIFKRFNELKIDYLIVGGLAVNLHGVPRMTYDIDAIYVKISEEKLPVINIHDLILIKLETGRKQDLADVESLKKILELKSNGQ